MKDLKARVAYLHGLSAGLNLEAESKEGRILNGIIKVLDDFADSMGGIEETQEQLGDYLESIDEDLYHLEDEIYELDDVASDYHEVKCPGCGEIVCFESDILEDDDVIEVTCPNCDGVVFKNDDSYLVAEEPQTMETGQITGSIMDDTEEDI